MRIGVLEVFNGDETPKVDAPPRLAPSINRTQLAQPPAGPTPPQSNHGLSHGLQVTIDSIITIPSLDSCSGRVLPGWAMVKETVM